MVAAVHTNSEKVHVRLKQDPTPWLAYEGRWGSTVEAPAMQEWFAKAENPVSRPWIAQVSTLWSGNFVFLHRSWQGNMHACPDCFAEGCELASHG